jgi:nucleotidyltransferase/DNA polymerase involved in DNA repair
MFHDIVTNDHSPRTASSPRSRNCRNRIPALMIPKTGSTVCLRFHTTRARRGSSADTVLSQADLPTRIWPLPARIINGIGPRASAKLEALGIRTVGELAAANEVMLIETFGSRYGRWLRDAAHGRDERPVVTERTPKSMSRETTFERDLHPRRDRETLSQILLELCQRVGGDLMRQRYLGKTVGIKLRYADFHTLTRDITLEAPTADAETIRSAARACLRRVPLDRRLRLLGVRVASLVHASCCKDTTDPVPVPDDHAVRKSLLLFD